MPEPTFQGEMQLAGWTESHTGGAKITLWLPDSESLDVFRGLTTKRGNKAGQRFAVVMVEIGDDETPQAKPKGGELARLAGRWCQMPEFQQWVSGEAGYAPFSAVADECRKFICTECSIESRAELDHNPAAAQAFHRNIREPFMQWCRENGVTL